MLAFDFDYYLPDTIEEAVDIFDTVNKQGKKPLYYGGGTEIISMSRVYNVRPDAVIDIKNIPECCGLGTDGNSLCFGAAATLGDIYESRLFPLLGLAANRIADHTIQCKITLGGNLAGTIYYHETLLPLLLSDAMIHIASPLGAREVPIADVLRMDRGLKPGELIVRVRVDNTYASLPYAHVKKSKIEKIGYPLVTLCAMCHEDGTMRTAVSGLCTYPFRFSDSVISNESPVDVADHLLKGVPAPVLDDLGGSANYRTFILKKTIENIVDTFQNPQEVNHA